MKRGQDTAAGGRTLPGSTPAAPIQDGPVQLVRVERRDNGWHFEVNEEAVKVLEGFGQRRIAVCTICGPYRTGKSYLLNLLLGRIQQGRGEFRVGSTTRACTEGLWMWGLGDAVGDTSILFMDCEGFGSTESDKLRDAKLMSLCLLISSVFLLNTKGVLNEGLFNALSLVCNLAEHVEERGHETSKPALLWLLRDFILDLRDEEDRTLTPDEYLERALHAKPLSSSADARRSQAAQEVRECLVRFFPQRSCVTLVQPLIDEDRLRQLAQVPYGELRTEFRSQFEALQSRLLSLAKARLKTVGGQPVSAAGLAALLRRLVHALNSNNVLNVGTAWEQVQRSSCEELVQQLYSECAAAAKQVREGGPLPGPGGQSLPVRDDTLMQALKEGRRAIREAFRAQSLGDEAVRATYWQELRSRLAEEEKGLERLNSRLAEEQLASAGNEWEAWLGQDSEAATSDPRAEALANLIAKGMPAQPAARAAAQALNASRLARLRSDRALAALKAELTFVSEEFASKVAVHAEASAKLDDSAIEHVRERARLAGQVDVLQSQVQEAGRREEMLKKQVLEAEEATRREQRAQSELQQKCLGLERTIRELEEKAAAGGAQAEDLRRPDQDRHGKGQRPTQPKCQCLLM